MVRVSKHAHPFSLVDLVANNIDLLLSRTQLLSSLASTNHRGLADAALLISLLAILGTRRGGRPGMPVLRAWLLGWD
eukprot:scaffold6844_cov357-Prasinococcus_capsulatus_cf.AAC.6